MDYSQHNFKWDYGSSEFGEATGFNKKDVKELFYNSIISIQFDYFKFENKLSGQEFESEERVKATIDYKNGLITFISKNGKPAIEELKINKDKTEYIETERINYFKIRGEENPNTKFRGEVKFGNWLLFVYTLYRDTDVISKIEFLVYR